MAHGSIPNISSRDLFSEDENIQEDVIYKIIRHAKRGMTADEIQWCYDTLRDMSVMRAAYRMVLSRRLSIVREGDKLLLSSEGAA